MKTNAATQRCDAWRVTLITALNYRVVEVIREVLRIFNITRTLHIIRRIVNEGLIWLIELIRLTGLKVYEAEARTYNYPHWVTAIDRIQLGHLIGVVHTCNAANKVRRQRKNQSKQIMREYIKKWKSGEAKIPTVHGHYPRQWAEYGQRHRDYILKYRKFFQLFEVT